MAKVVQISDIVLRSCQYVMISRPWPSGVTDLDELMQTGFYKNEKVELAHMPTGDIKGFLLDVLNFSDRYIIHRMTTTGGKIYQRRYWWSAWEPWVEIPSTRVT